MILSDLQSLVDDYLGANYIYQADKKTRTLNQARKWLLSNFDVQESIRTVDVVFTSGKATIPDNFLRSVKLFLASTGEYWVRVNENDFDSNVAKTYTIKWDETSNTHKIHIFPAESRTIKLRHVFIPDDMSASTDDSGLRTAWDEALACYSAYQILANDRQAESGNKYSQAKDLIRMAIKNQYGDQRESADFQSIYDNDYSLLGSENG